MDGSDFPPATRDRRGRFLPGHPGRPFGSRNRERLARAILKDCEGELDELPPRMRRCFLPLYIGLVARLAPKVNEAALASLLCDVRVALDTAWRGEPREPGGRHAGRAAQ